MITDINKRKRIKILRITTVPMSFNLLLKGQMNFMNKNGFEVFAASSEGVEIDEIKTDEGVEHIIIPFTRVLSPLMDLVCLWKTIMLIKKIKPHIVHSHTPKAGLISMLAAWIMRVPYRLHTVAGMPLMETKGILRAILVRTERITYACANKIYPNSNSLYLWILKSLNPKASKIKIIGSGSSNGINLQHFKNTERIQTEARALRLSIGIHPDDIVFIFIGRLVRDKGITELIHAFNKIKSENTHLLLIGEFEDQREPLTLKIKNLIRRDKQIHALGFKKDIRPFLAASDIFVFPSYREGFPNVVLQACSFNLPCIVTDINGCNEIIEHNRNGLIVEPKDSNELAKAMKLLLNDGSLKEVLAAEARKSVLTYDQQYYWKELLKEYEKMTK